MGLENSTLLYFNTLTKFVLKENFNNSTLKQLQELGHFKEANFEEKLNQSKKDDVIVVADYLRNIDIDLNVKINGKEVRWSKLIKNYMDSTYDKLIAPNMFKPLASMIIEIINVQKGEDSSYGEFIQVKNDWNVKELVEYSIIYLFTNTFIDSTLLDRLADVYEKYRTVQIVNYVEELNKLNILIIENCIRVGQSFEEVVNGLDLPLLSVENQLEENTIVFPFKEDEEDYVYLVSLNNNSNVFKLNMKTFLMMYEKDYLKTLTVGLIPCRVKEGKDVLTKDLNSLIVRTTDGSDKPLQTLIDSTFVFNSVYDYTYL